MAGGLQSDLIAAVATPPGQGGIGVVRLSGTGARQLAEDICHKSLVPRTATYASFSDGEEVIDQGLVLLFSHGASFTGEEVVELQGHGGPVVLQRLLNAVCKRGARIAEPGEFSQRAFLNGKIDLAQAEAIADLIASTSVAAARAALRSLQGVFSAQVDSLSEDLAKLRVLVEACIDFPDEDVEFLEDGQVAQKIANLIVQIERLHDACQQGQRLNEGAGVALMGAPNAGKSSLLNVLSGEDAAIVTDIPGTTRDLLKVDMLIDGVPLRLVDTAGLRDSGDQVEQIGVARAKQQAQLADLLLLIIDAADSQPDGWEDQVASLLKPLEHNAQVLVVMNKVDLLAAEQIRPENIGGYPTYWLSAKNQIGLDALRHAITQTLGLVDTETTFTARARHVAALDLALLHLRLAENQLSVGEATEIIAEELSTAHLALGEIVGTVTPDDLLGRIFSEFCIGK